MNAMKNDGFLSEFTANPRFLDRLNAVCALFMVLVLASLIYLALQARTLHVPVSGELESAIESISTIESAEAPAAPTNVS